MTDHERILQPPQVRANCDSVNGKLRADFCSVCGGAQNSPRDWVGGSAQLTKGLFPAIRHNDVALVRSLLERHMVGTCSHSSHYSISRTACQRVLPPMGVLIYERGHPSSYAIFLLLYFCPVVLRCADEPRERRRSRAAASTTTLASCCTK
jgi:hypothetical protein